MTPTLQAPARASAAPLRALLDTQRAAFAAGPPGYRQRVEVLRALEDVVGRRRHDIIDAVATDFGGRAAEETLALELLPLQNELRAAHRNLHRWMKPRRAAVPWHLLPARARVVYQPLGVVAVLSPWNYPFFLSLSPLAGILAAGNHAILKPSELAPASAALMGTLMDEVCSPSHVAVVTGGPETADALARLPLDHLLFTGSTRVGRLVMQAASEHLVPVTLELGGKSPAIVHAGYPLEKAAATITTGKLYNAGQTCVAPDYAVVPRGRAREFAEAAAAVAARMFPAPGRNPHYTRIISVHHYRRLRHLLDDARARGAEIVSAASSEDGCDESTRVFPPTFVVGVRGDMLLMQEEIFGPILPITEHRGMDDAIAAVEARPRPLALYYFDYDRTRVKRLLQRVVAGGITVNDCLLHVGVPGLPFGGVGPSGMGRYHGFDGFQTFSNRTGVLLQRRWSPLSLLRPPYRPRTRQLLDMLVR